MYKRSLYIYRETMLSFAEGMKALIKKLEFNPVSLGGRSIYTSILGITLGAIVMVFVISYAVGKIYVLRDPPNVVSNTFEYQNDPYQINLAEWRPRISIFQKVTNRYIGAHELYQMGLNITVWNLEGEDLQKRNPSVPIQDVSDPQKMTIDQTKTPLNISGSSYVHNSPKIKQYQIQIQFCTKSQNPRCSQNNTRIYQLSLFLNPQWVYLQNPSEPAIRETNFKQKLTIDRTKSTPKCQYIYDIYGFNVTSQTSLLPAFFPREVSQQSGSSMAAPATKIYLPQQAENIVEFHFRRDEKSVAYTRKYNSIDQVFADILGVVALFGVILWGLFGHYNSWGSEEYILKNILGQRRPISLLAYLKFYLMCKKRSAKQEKILKQVHQDMIESYKERKKRKIEIEILNLRVNAIEKKVGLVENLQQCKKQILEKLEEEENKELFSSSILTEQIRTSLLTK